MNRDEFLRTLREALSGEIPPNIIEENIRYYDAYIADEVRKGRTEEEVIEELGGARVIAKTIIDRRRRRRGRRHGGSLRDAWQESAYGGGGSGRQSSSGGYGSGSAGGVRFRRRRRGRLRPLRLWQPGGAAPPGHPHLQPGQMVLETASLGCDPADPVCIMYLVMGLATLLWRSSWWPW